MVEKELIELLKNLISLPKETEWLEFKENNFDHQSIGEVHRESIESIFQFGRNFYLMVIKWCRGIMTGLQDKEELMVFI